MSGSEFLFANFEHRETREPENVFLAIYPGEPVRGQVYEFARMFRETHKLWGKLRRIELLHATLVAFKDFPGDLADLVAEVGRASSKITRTVKPFEVEFDRIKSYPGKDDKSKALVVAGDQNGELHDLHSKLIATIQIPVLSKKLDPHVTLLYDKQFIAEQALLQPVRWRVDEIVLVRSLVGEGTHIPLGRWPLRG